MTGPSGVKGFSTFRARIFWSLIPIILFLFIVLGVIDLSKHKQLGEEEFMKRGQVMAANLAYSSELGVFAEDDQLLESSLLGVIGDADVAYVFIYGEDGMLLATRGEMVSVDPGLTWDLSDQAKAQLLRDRQTFSKSVMGEGRRFVEFFAPIVSQEGKTPDEFLIGPIGKAGQQRTIGAVRLGLSFQAVDAHIAALLRWRGGLIVAFLVLSTLAIYVISRRITRPVKQLTDQAKKIADGFLDQVIPVDSRDEIGQLALSFNNMTWALKGNISEKERVLAELQDLNHTLEERIRQRTGEIEAINTQLREATRHKSEFLANMSHELRTPLNAVIGFSEILLGRMLGDLNSKQEEYLHDIMTSGLDLLSLINDILDLSKVEAGRMELDLNTFDLPMLLDNTLRFVKERASRHGIQLTLEVDERLGDFMGDERKVKQVLLNLLSNALKFTPDGGRIILKTAPADGLTQISVSDTGIGIATENLQQIFEEFQQIRGDHEGKGEGTGLGLALAKKFVELHGGTIWVESVVGRGSTFTFTLPMRAPVEKATESPTMAQPAPNQTQLVLVVEDDPRAVKLLSTYLFEEGYTIEVASDGEEGLKKARALHPAVVALDILLPKVDGWEFLTRIKADPETCGIPIIIVSVVEERGKGFTLGAVDYLTKPFQREELIAALRRISISTRLRDPAAKVLAIDDDPMALELVRAIGEAEGYRVLSATGGEEGVALAKAELPALIILDLIMPEVDGFDVVVQLGDDPTTRAIPIVILTNKQLTTGEKNRLNGRISHMAQKGEFRRANFVDLVNRLAGRGGSETWLEH
ncbi:MAG: response regulator [Deltaproteobacteria bacterium]|nr:response regulator [Deltaproteobacteria bacterium]